jgi:hypothetical protein
VLVFILAALFIAVYWPLSVQPDGGTAALEGCGWVPALLTLAYVAIWLQARSILLPRMDGSLDPLPWSTHCVHCAWPAGRRVAPAGWRCAPLVQRAPSTAHCQTACRPPSPILRPPPFAIRFLTLPRCACARSFSARSRSRRPAPSRAPPRRAGCARSTGPAPPEMPCPTGPRPGWR